MTNSKSSKLGRVLVVVPCKYHSSRLPGKNFETIGTKTLTRLAVEAAAEVCEDPVVMVVEQGTDEEVPDNYDGFHVDGLDCFVVSMPYWYPGKSAALVALWALLTREDAFDTVVLLQPSSVRHPELVAEALKYIEAGHNSVVSVSEVRHPVGGGPCHQYDGGVYAWKADWLMHGCFLPLNKATLLHGRHRLGDKGVVVDIDTAADLAYAREIFKGDGNE